MKIVITGGAGFLGTHLCRALDKAGHNIRVIDLKENPEYKTEIADVRDTDKMRELITSDTDLVFHLASLIEAGESVKFPQKFIDNNILGTISVLEAMRSNGVKSFIFSSSAAVYGEPIRVPIEEDDRTLPISPYGMTKLAMEGLLSSYVAAHQFSGVALRYFNLYGPEEHHQPETHAIPRFIEQISNEDIVTVWGNGEHKRDYLFIDDVVDAHLRSIELINDQPNQYHYMNLSTETATSVMDVIMTVANALEKKPIIKHFDPRPGDPLVLVADASKAKKLLGWSAQVDFITGIERTVEYFREQSNEEND